LEAWELQRQQQRCVQGFFDFAFVFYVLGVVAQFSFHLLEKVIIVVVLAKKGVVQICCNLLIGGLEC
jgi:hypothetical protein